ncbi:MAG: DUF975 family protein [Lachnospiraceae bacterium]|nr:DUF975 family protein [Lachnospiraceae bacterium]
MWTRKDLKKKGRVAFSKNYWKAVLVAVLITTLTAGVSSASSSSNAMTNAFKFNKSSKQAVETVKSDDEDTSLHLVFDFDDDKEDKELIIEDISDDVKQFQNDADEVLGTNVTRALAAAALGFVMLVATAIILAIVLGLNAFIINPLVIGANRFFYKNLDEPSDVAEVAFAYDHSYLNSVKVMFFRDIKTIGWTLLFIIPGIVKSYEYRMIPYLLAEDPELSSEEAFAMSKQMMHGQKWRAFVLDLSFIGWHILSLITLGLLAVFFVAPYQFSVNAALYEALRYGDGEEVVMIEGERENVTYEL